LDSHELDAVRELTALGVVRLASRPLQPGEDSQILVSGEGTGGPPVQDWQAFDTWLTAFLYDPHQADVRQKLLSSGPTSECSPVNGHGFFVLTLDISLARVA
jgi:hypothetical protein